MLNLSQNPLFWPNQVNVVVDQNKPNIFIGCGVATKSEISQALPFDIIGFLLSAEFIKRQIPNSKIFLLIADQHAWLANNFDKSKAVKSADNLEQIAKKIILNFKLNDWRISRASQIFPKALPQSYEELETRDVKHFFNDFNCGLKIGWSFSLAEKNHKTDEFHFDTKIPMQSIFTKPGVTANPAKPFESPYICTDPASRLTIAKLSTSQVESKINPAMKKHLNRIVVLVEKSSMTFAPKTPLETKIQQITQKVLR